MNIGEIIYNRRKELNLTLEQVGDFVGVGKSTVKKWETGSIANIKRDKISKLATILQLSPIVFITGDEQTTPAPPTDEEIHSAFNVLDNSYIRSIPLYESVSAGFGAYASETIIDYIPLYIRCDYEAENTLCIKVVGDSMYPKIEDGDIVQVLKQPSIDSGQTAVVLIDGDEGLVKKVTYGDDWIELHSFNPEYKTKRFEGAEVQRVRVLGLVKTVIKTMV